MEKNNMAWIYAFLAFFAFFLLHNWSTLNGIYSEIRLIAYQNVVAAYGNDKTMYLVTRSGKIKRCSFYEVFPVRDDPLIPETHPLKHTSYTEKNCVEIQDKPESDNKLPTERKEP